MNLPIFTNFILFDNLCYQYSKYQQVVFRFIYVGTQTEGEGLVQLTS